MNYPVWPESGSSAGPPGFSRSSNVRSPPDDPAGKSPSKFNGQNSSGGRSNSEVQQEVSKYATLTATPAFSEEENLLKAAAHFLSSGQSGRHYSSTMGYPNPAGTVAVSTPSSSYNCHPAGQQSRNSAEAAGRTGLMENSSSGGGMANGTSNHPLLSPCGAMEEASSPGSAANSQISYLGALQNPASLTQLGFPNHYLLSKDGAGLAAAAAAAAHHAAQQHHQVMNNSSGSIKKKEPKPGSDVRSFICQVCGRGFKQKATLAQHERTHTDERPFDCPDCHKRFRQQSHLVQHIRIHSDERPYACTYCDKAFRQKAILNQHIRIHTGEKPYVCPQCTKCFRQKAILNQHIRTHSGKRPYSCPDSKCKKKFVDQVSMEKHFKKHIEDDQNQLLAEARGLIGANSGGGGSGGGAGGGGGAITSPSSAADRINHNAKGLLRVKLDRPPSNFNRLSQDRATSPFPINMMMIRGQQQPNNNNSPGRSNELPTQQEVNSYHHHQAVAAAAAAASGPYQFVPFPHRPYHYDLLGLGSMGQSIYGGNNKMMEQAASTKYRESLDVNNQMSNQVVEPNNVANTYSTPVNSTANSKSDGGP